MRWRITSRFANKPTTAVNKVKEDEDKNHANSSNARNDIESDVEASRTHSSYRR